MVFVELRRAPRAGGGGLKEEDSRLIEVVALCGALGWRWRQMTSGRQCEKHRFCLQNKPIKAPTMKAQAKRFRLRNRRCNPQDDKSFIMNYFQLDDIEIDDKDCATVDYFQMDDNVSCCVKEDAADDECATVDGESDREDDTPDVDDNTPDTTSASKTDAGAEQRLTAGDLWRLSEGNNVTENEEEWEILDTLTAEAAWQKVTELTSEIKPVAEVEPIAEVETVKEVMPVTENQEDSEHETAHQQKSKRLAVQEPAGQDTELLAAFPSKKKKTTTKTTKKTMRQQSVQQPNFLLDKPKPTSVEPRTPPVTTVVKKPSANTTAKNSVEQPKVEDTLRIQGKMRSRDLYKTTANGTRVRARGSKLTFGFIEVNPKDLKALEQHPAWSPDLQCADVFWHWKDCMTGYDQQFGGDIVTFSVVLKPDGSALQAKEVKLERHAQWWHAIA